MNYTLLATQYFGWSTGQAAQTPSRVQLHLVSHLETASADVLPAGPHVAHPVHTADPSEIGIHEIGRDPSATLIRRSKQSRQKRYLPRWGTGGMRGRTTR